MTFYGWKKRLQSVPASRSPVFAQVDVPIASQAAVEVLLPNGVRVGIRQEGGRQELVALIRGVAGYGEAHLC